MQVAIFKQSEVAVTHRFKKLSSKTSVSCLQPNEETVLSLKQCCLWIPNYFKNVTESMKDLNKHITAIDALALDPFSRGLNFIPSGWKHALLKHHYISCPFSFWLLFDFFCFCFCSDRSPCYSQKCGDALTGFQERLRKWSSPTLSKSSIPKSLCHLWSSGSSYWRNDHCPFSFHRNGMVLIVGIWKKTSNTSIFTSVYTF